MQATPVGLVQGLVITVVVVYVILDLDYLREGLIRLQTADQLLAHARETMN